MGVLFTDGVTDSIWDILAERGELASSDDEAARLFKPLMLDGYINGEASSCGSTS